MQEYINGCYTKYGTRPLNISEIKQKGQLCNGMWFVGGIIPTKEDGISIDVYKDKDMKELLFMEHGIITNIDINSSEGLWIFKTMAENRLKEMRLI